MGIFSGLFGNTKTIKPTMEVIPTTEKDTMPFDEVLANGIVRAKDGTWSKAYTLGELNFLVESRGEQTEIIGRYMEFIGSFGSEIQMQVLVFNDTVSHRDFEKDVLLNLRSDGLNEYRMEMNAMLEDKMSQARNNNVHRKYIIISTEAADAKSASQVFARIDTEMAKGGQRVANQECKPLDAMERMELMHRMDQGSRAAIQSALLLSDAELSFSTSAGPGQGIVCCSGQVFPFVDEFPEETALYAAFAAKPNRQQKGVA